MKKYSTHNQHANGKERKKMLPFVKIFVLLRRSNLKSGIETAGESCRPFLCPNIIYLQALGLVVCGSSNARKDLLFSPEQHHRPFLFNVQKNKEK
ncbi:MAG: hypothetical protein IKZ56_02590 [Bacteroidales bacterium]|nr:hypothetical protein [Bacteroidales bacterium]